MDEDVIFISGVVRRDTAGRVLLAMRRRRLALVRWVFCLLCEGLFLTSRRKKNPSGGNLGVDPLTTSRQQRITATRYKFRVYLCACWYAYSILRTIVPGPIHPLAHKLFDIFLSTIALSSFGPYCPLWHEHIQTKCIGAIPTPWAMTHTLGLVSFPPQHE